MTARSRREFLADVGRGTLTASLGAALATDMGFTSARAAEGPERLTFGALEPLVNLMQDTPADKLMPLLVERLKTGTEAKTLVAAGALANARTFGGEDYTGYHTLMALAPAHQMSNELPVERRALPILKVLYRNATRIQEKGGRSSEVLHPIKPPTVPSKSHDGVTLREAVRRQDMAGAERIFAELSQGQPAKAFDHLLTEVQDGEDVHRIVLPYRAWCLIDLVGPENAHTLLRQSVRYCVKEERHAQTSQLRTLLPKLFDQYKLPRKEPGQKPADDAWVANLSETFFKGPPSRAAEAAASALAEGFHPDAVGEAISLAANQLVLRDAGRRDNETRPGKGVGSVHGDSIGVHASDAANAWRQMAKAAGPRNAAACLIAAAYKTAKDRIERGGDFLVWQPRPWTEHKALIKANEPAALVRELDEAIKAGDQAKACAAAAKAGDINLPPRQVFDVLLRYACSEEGALHAEKYYRTVREDFASTRAAFRWRHIAALARVTASEYGQPAAGYAEICKLLGV